MGNQQNESHRECAADISELVAGSLAWEVEELAPGASLFREETGESTRRVCFRAIAVVRRRKPERKYRLSLWLARPLADDVKSMRLYRIERVK